MNENKDNIVQVRDAKIIAAEVNTIKRQTQNYMLNSCIEIGRRLLEAKELVPFGSWTQYLKDEMDYSQSTADNLMRIAKEYGDNQINLFSGTSNSQTFKNLTYSQAVALFALPSDERTDFVQANDVESMTSRQLQDAIKAKEQAEAEKGKLQNVLDGTEQKLKIASENKDKLEQALKKSDDGKAAAERKAADEIIKLKDELAAAGADQTPAPSPEELEKMRAGVRAKIEAEFKEKENQLTLEKKTAEEKAAEIEKKYKERLKKLKLDNESITARQKAVEKKLAVSAPEAQQIDAYLKIIQQSFQNITAALHTLDGENPEMAGKLRKALCTVLESLVEQVKIK